MSNSKNAWQELNRLIDEFSENRESHNADKLQSLREEISLQLFYLSDGASKALSNFDKADYERKRNYAKLIEDNKYDREGNKNTVSVTESLARIQNEEYEEATVEAMRQKERVKIALSSVNQILNAISSRLHSLKN